MRPSQGNNPGLRASRGGRGVSGDSRAQLVGLMLGLHWESQLLERERLAVKMGWSLHGGSFQFQA